MTVIKDLNSRVSIFEAKMKWTVPILMLLILTITFNKGIVWLSYKANQDLISKNLCVNKLKPRLHCNGKCQLMKKMAEDQQEDSSVPRGMTRILPDESF